MKSGYFFDMDGTLYNNTFHSISYKTIQALHQIKNQGDEVFLATSRCLKELQHLPRQMYNFPFSARILDGGSYILNDKKEILLKESIPFQTIETIDSYCKRNHLLYRYSTSNGNYFGTNPNYFPLLYNLQFILYLEAPVYKAYQKDEVLNILICFKNETQAKEILEIVQDCDVTSYPNGFEIRAKNRNKSQAIQDMVNHYNIDQVICFGDGLNDIDMIQQADIGIAMGNACKEVKQAANQVIGNVDKDGIYHYLIQQGICKEVD